MLDLPEHLVRQCGEDELRQAGCGNVHLDLDEVRRHADESHRKGSGERHQNAARKCSTVAAPTG
jgi:hypothetical protein